MSSGAQPLAYRRLRAPREDRSALVDPPWEQVAAAVESNRRLRDGYQYDFHGVPLATLARQARRELLREAAGYTAQYVDLSTTRGGEGESGRGGEGEGDAEPRVFLAGHQPQLFHPGVWFKNFALGALARQHGAVAVNLVIDSDAMKSHALRVPGGTAADPHSAMIPLDDPGPVIPFEERPIVNRDVFAAFGDRVAEQIAPLVPNPLVRDLWPLATARMHPTGNLGACLAQSRHQLERRLGLTTLEIPQSRVCGLGAFRHFTAHLLAELERLVPVYNEAVHEYRRAHRMRSTAHPVPDLAVDGAWREAPFWIWTAADPRRRHLFVARRGRELVLSDRHALEFSLPLGPAGGLDRAVERLAEAAQSGVKIRCRALITTLWARLVLGDLFIHGIGGAKYDQLTDALIERFFGLPAPQFLVLSATLLLPVEHQRVTADQARAIDRQLRDLVYHPETAIDVAACARSDCEAAQLIAAKRRWIATPQTRQNARTRCREIRRVNAALQALVEGRRQDLLRRRAVTAAALGAESILSWREYAFCLYPERFLRDCFAALLPSGHVDARH